MNDERIKEIAKTESNVCYHDDSYLEPDTNANICKRCENFEDDDIVEKMIIEAIKQALAERDAEIVKVIEKEERNIIKLVSDEHTAKATIKYIVAKIKQGDV